MHVSYSHIDDDAINDILLTQNLQLEVLAPRAPRDEAWKPAGGASLSVRCFEGELIVYNPLSGRTHYLDIVSGKALTLVAAGVCETPAICSEIAAFLGVDIDNQVAALVHQTLEKLEEVKLIERAAE